MRLYAESSLYAQRLETLTGLSRALTASLDPDTADWVRGFLARYAQEADATFLIASHNMLEVERLCDQVLMMRQGKIVDSGAPKALIAKYGRTSLEDVFLEVARYGAREAAS